MVCLICNHSVCNACILIMNKGKKMNDTLSCPMCRNAIRHSDIMSVVKDCYPLKDYPEDATFDFMGEHCANMIQSAYRVVHENNAWQTLLFYTKKENEGYQHPKNNGVDQIMDKIVKKYPLHSGGSIGFTMKHIHYIAQHGYEEYKCQYIASTL